MGRRGCLYFRRPPVAVRSSQAASDSDAAVRRQTQTNNDASGNPQRVAGRPLGRPLRMRRPAATNANQQRQLA